MVDLPTNFLSTTIRIPVDMSGELLTGGKERSRHFSSRRKAYQLRILYKNKGNKI